MNETVWSYVQEPYLMFFLNCKIESFGNFIGMLIFFLCIYKRSFQMSYTFMRLLTLALLCKVQYFPSLLLLTFLSVFFAMYRFLILLPLNIALSPRPGAVGRRSYPMPPRPKPGAVARRTNPTSKEPWLRGCRRA